MAEEWRLEVELDDERHGFSLGERLRAHNLDDEAQERLGGRATVTRDGSKLFVYTDSHTGALEAENVLRQLLEDDKLSANLWITRWHPDAETWKDRSEPIPETESDREAERRGRDAAAAADAKARGEMPFEVRVDTPQLSQALELAERLAGEEMQVERRWRHILIGVASEEEAEEIAIRMRSELPEAEVEIEASGVKYPPFTLLGWSN
ncbi:MAG: hypothetical protein ACR2OC_06490 [Solirubrobacterales bacterium]